LRESVKVVLRNGEDLFIGEEVDLGPTLLCRTGLLQLVL
jgi:hypothetical protein